jgi:hypothetical protein
VTRRARLAAVALTAAGLAVAAASAQSHPETFTATASVKYGEASASAPVTVTITRWATADERATVVKAVREQGSGGARKTLSALGDAGVIELGSRRTAIKFAGARPTGSGRLVTLITAEPILFLGAGIPGAQPREGFDVAVAMLDLNEAGEGLGELAPAAKVALDAHGALTIDDYGATVMWLKGLARAKSK